MNVEKTSMSIALYYIRHGQLPEEFMQNSPVFIKDISYLIPGIDIKSKPKKKIWKCGAYCSDGNNSQIFNYGLDKDLFAAWEKLNNLCKNNSGYLTKDMTLWKRHVMKYVMPSMKDACIEIEE